MWHFFCVHSLGTVELSRSCPQGRLSPARPGWSPAWGTVDKPYPQPVDKKCVHRAFRILSTDSSLPPTGRGRLCTANPHRCPLFGNKTPALTVASERRHTKVPGWPVGNRGKAGDRAGEKSALPVHGVCRTFARPQRPPVIHWCRPQGRWTKNRV
ncbi:hypothetical protein GBW32_18090 [Streptomyces tsukubensis]|nr:hypothetical protein GBW32_18090 [Streptomyces tsukubensis]